MTALKGPRIDGFVKQPDLTTGFILVYGADKGLVHERAALLMRHFSGADADPLSAISLNMANLTAEPERLAVEARTPSLFGGSRVIRIRDAGNALVPALEELLTDWPDAVVIAEADNLTPRDKLRALAEKSPQARTLPCFADNEADRVKLIGDSFAQDKITLDSGVAAALADLLGNDREVTRREIEKLKLFAYDSKHLTVNDVVELCGDNTTLAMDQIVDATATGHVAKMESALSRALTGGINPNQIMTSALTHFNLLRQWRAAIHNGASAAEAMKITWPRPHFTRTRSIEQQLRLWNDATLGKAAERIYEATRDMRKSGQLPDTLARRALLAICITAAQK